MIIKINNFRGDLSDISAKTATLVLINRQRGYYKVKALARMLVVSINECTLCLQKKRKADGEGGKQAQGKRKRAPGEKKPWWEEDNGGRHERDDDAAYYREEVRTVSFSPALPVIIYRMTSANVC